MTLTDPRALGATGVSVGPIGISSTFGRSAKDIEWTFDLGCTYLVLKSRRQPGFMTGLKTLAKTKRDQLVLAVEAAPSCSLALRLSLELSLRRLGIHHVDFLLLGPREGVEIDRIVETAARLQTQGKVRFLGLSLPRRKKGDVPLHRLGSALGVVHAPCSAADPHSHTSLFPSTTETKPGIVAFGATANGTLLRSRPGMGRAASVADCYRFVLSQPGIAVCLAGSPGPSELRAALESLREGPMGEEQLTWMQGLAAAAKGTAHRLQSKNRVLSTARPGGLPVSVG